MMNWKKKTIVSGIKLAMIFKKKFDIGPAYNGKLNLN